MPILVEVLIGLILVAIGVQIAHAKKYGFFWKTLQKKGITHGQLTQLCSYGLLDDLLEADLPTVDRRVVRRALNLYERFELTVLPDIDFSHRVEVGNYNSIQENITSEYFSIDNTQIGKFEGRYFEFGSNPISSERAVAILTNSDERNPWNLAQTAHLLSFGENFPDEQKKYPIIALGAIAMICEKKKVLSLFKGDFGRYLYHRNWSDEWPGGCRFLAVRRLS